MTVNDSQKAVILEAVKNAMENPYEVTQSTYTTKP